MCAVKGRRNKIQALSDMVMKDSSEWEEEANDLEDKIYLYTTFKAYFLMLSIVWFVLIAILVGIVAGVTAPPSEVGTDEVCGPKPHCNGQGTCDAAGECWCVVGMFTDSSKCENVAGTGIVAIIFLVFFLLGFMKFYGRFRFFSKELVVLKKTLEERMVDLEKMIAAEQGEA